MFNQAFCTVGKQLAGPVKKIDRPVKRSNFNQERLSGVKRAAFARGRE
jgi:hypothetical protein